MQLLRYPWQGARLLSDLHLRAYGGPEFLVSAGLGSTLLVSGAAAFTSDSVRYLPDRTIVSSLGTFSAVELPGPGVGGDIAVEDRLAIHSGDDGRREVVLRFENRHAITPRHGDEEHAALTLPFESFFDRIVGLMQTLVDQMVPRRRPTIVYWDECLNWLSNLRGEDIARRALIVELAENLPSAVQRIRSAPRKRLMRVRQNERLHRIQQIDRQCIVDLSRKPGATIAEKAGAKQRLLAVKRLETSDTLENRVSMHFCELARLAARRYLRENEETANSGRCIVVGRFSRLCREMLLDPRLSEIQRLSAPCRMPNYTLLQNALYRKIWLGYEELLKDEEVRDVLWRWPRRVWADVARLYVAQSLDRWFESADGSARAEPYRRICRLARENSCGRWTGSGSYPGPYIVGPSPAQALAISLLDSDELRLVSPFVGDLAMLGADVYIVAAGETVVRVVPVYAVMGDSTWGDPLRRAVLYREMAEDLRACLVACNSSVRPGRPGGAGPRVSVPSALVVSANWQGNPEIPEVPTTSDDMVHSIWLSGVPNTWSMPSEAFRRAVESALRSHG